MAINLFTTKRKCHINKLLRQNEIIHGIKKSSHSTLKNYGNQH
jgi:hypothetical protein